MHLKKLPSDSFERIGDADVPYRSVVKVKD